MERYLGDIRDAISQSRVLWKKHTLEKMLERGISRSEVKRAVLGGQVIESYPDDYPLPSLLLCSLEPEPLHVVLAWNPESGECHIITAYRPDLEHFEPGFVRRRQK